ncbi:MAG: DUF4203 domain-containing protein [Nitrospiraceae bacterium]|nr:DUF4203 domain-containing protein [Nitrospiraceae bacterium]
MDFWTNLHLQSVSPDYLRGGVAASVAVGMLYCFLGYRLFKAVLVCTGFCLAGAAAGVIAGAVTQGNLLFAGIAAAAGGLAGALTFLFLYHAGVVCLGVLTGVLLANVILGARLEPWVPSAMLGTAIFAGLVALVFERAVMTVATAIIGGWVAAHGIAFFILGATSIGEMEAAAEQPHARWTLLTCWIVLAAAGAITQFATHTPKAGEEGA